jgi:1-deoxy-D-xylulose-5-phosphate reductoisomerase
MAKTQQKIVILGSTGSIGINALDVIARYRERFKVIGLTAYNNLDVLEQQVRRFSPTHVAVGTAKIPALRERLSGRRVKILNADHDLCQIVRIADVDTVVIGMSGSVALEPFLSAVRAGKTVAPANKEALVIAGQILMREAKKYRAKIIPVDSEQSAIFQCLQGQDRRKLKRVYLTASGGPLRQIPKFQFRSLTVADILKHPRWKMGKKITVDSATMLNKGFEIIEAIRLFDLKVREIQVLIHPEAIIHSMVEFVDGSIIAQMGITDMRLPIQYALTFPQRWPSGLRNLDFNEFNELTFHKPDFSKFPALALSQEVAEWGGTYPAVLNAADEVVVEAFLSQKIPFLKIHEILEKVVTKHRSTVSASLPDVLAADSWAREEAQGMIDAVRRKL